MSLGNSWLPDPDPRVFFLSPTDERKKNCLIFAAQIKRKKKNLSDQDSGLHLNLTLATKMYSCMKRILARVVRKVDNAIQRINHDPADSVVRFVNT